MPSRGITPCGTFLEGFGFRAWMLEFLWSLEFGVWKFQLVIWQLVIRRCRARALMNPPTLQIAAQLAWPIFLRRGHEHLATGLARPFEQRKKATAPVRIQLA